MPSTDPFFSEHLYTSSGLVHFTSEHLSTNPGIATQHDPQKKDEKKWKKNAKRVDIRYFIRILIYNADLVIDKRGLERLMGIARFGNF